MEEMKMESQQRMEREISLTELFWNILLGWRSIICLSVIFAILATGFGYYRAVRAYNASQNIDLEKEKEKLDKDDRNKLERAVHIQTRLDEYETYRDNAPLMQLDPYEKPVLELQYYVESDYIVNYTKDRERDYTSELTSMYYNYINGGELSQEIVKDAGLSISQSEFHEMMSVGRADNNLTITVSYADMGALETISGIIKSAMQQKESALQEVGSHKLKLIDESQNIVVDTTLLEKKNSVFNSITSLTNMINNLKTEMTSKQIRLFDYEISEMRGEQEEKEEPGISLKYLILGAFAGIFLACAWIVGRMIFTIRLQNPEEIRTMYQARLLGTIAVSKGKKRFLSVIDTIILNIRYKGRKQIPAEQQIKVIAASAALSCRRQGIDTIYLTGSEYEKADKTALEQLKRELSQQNIHVKDGGNILYDADSMRTAAEVGHILFVEQKGMSVYDEIYNEFLQVKEQNGDILGVVVLV